MIYGQVLFDGKLRDKLQKIRDRFKSKKESVIEKGIIPSIRTRIEEVSLRVKERVTPKTDTNIEPVKTVQTVTPTKLTREVKPKEIKSTKKLAF